MSDMDLPLAVRMMQDGYLMEIDALQAENEKLQDENERLRSCLSDSAENAKQIMHEAHVQEEENAKLREELAKWERLTANINLPEYPVSQFVPKDLERENEKLREQGARLFDKMLELTTENDKLRELVRDFYPFALGRAAKPWLAVRHDRMRELGVEV